MTEPSTRQIKEAVLRGLREVGERFAKNPRPTDGSVRAALELVRRKPRSRGKKSAAGA